MDSLNRKEREDRERIRDAEESVGELLASLRSLKGMPENNVGQIKDHIAYFILQYQDERLVPKAMVATLWDLVPAMLDCAELYREDDQASAIHAAAMELYKHIETLFEVT